MTERKIFEIFISLLQFLKTNEKQKLAKNFSDVESIAGLSLKDLSMAVGRNLITKEFNGDVLKKKLEHALKLIDRYRMQCSNIADDDYPQKLLRLSDPPFMLFMRGEKIKQEKMIGIVGTRKPTGYGMQTAFTYAQKLAQKNVTIVSGMAIGIDGYAHKGAVSVNCPTVAVLACSVDNLYPKSNTGLARKILTNGGTIVSEYPPETKPLQYRFLERNRIISGLSDVLIVIEAPKDSGALNTAKYALDISVLVAVIDEMLQSPQNTGGIFLTEHGAKVVHSVDELLNESNKKNVQIALFSESEGIYE